MNQKWLLGAIAPLAGLLVALTPDRASSQIVPRPWVSVGSQDGDLSVAIGARALGLGVEVGTIDDATGVDVLKFLSLPVISPYVGIGLYSDDEGVAFSGGVQVDATDRLFVGAGYNSVRGINGQLGISF